MKSSGNSILKIYASSTDRIGSRLFYVHMVHLAKEKGISGVTVYRGIMGYGPSSRHISSSRYWELTEKLPVVIEIIDETESLEAFYKLIEPELQQMKKGCLATLEPVIVKLHQAGKSNQ